MRLATDSPSGFSSTAALHLTANWSISDCKTPWGWAAESFNTRVFVVGANNSTHYFCFYTVRVQTNCSISAGWAKSGPKFGTVIVSWSLLPSAVIIMLAIHWEFLGTFINMSCVFLQDILLGLQTEWLFIDIFVLFIHFSLMMQGIILSFCILWTIYTVHFFFTQNY